MKQRKIWGLFLSLVVFVAACGDSEPFPPATPTATETATATVTETRPPTPTFTPNPNTPTVTSTPGGEPICGNGAIEAPEECDDGNIYGGDDCAANCTEELGEKAVCRLGGSSGALVQGALFTLPLQFTNSRVLATTGSPREDAVMTTDPNVSYPAGALTQVIKLSDLEITPLTIPGLICICVRGVELPEAGPGNAIKSVVGCGSGGLQGADIASTTDHNIADEDPTCATGKPDVLHPGGCQGQPQRVFSGSGPRGTSRLTANLSLSLISDGGICGTGNTTLYGPDGIACTPDDPNQAEPTLLESTTGFAEAAIVDLNNNPGAVMDKNSRCGSATCVVTATGSPIDCDAIESNPAIVPNGTKWVGASSSLDLAMVGDIILTSAFECQQQ